MSTPQPLFVKIVGTFHKRSITQGEVIDFRSACNDGNEVDDVPLLLYDCNTSKEESHLIPRYVAQKTTIPTSSTSLSAVAFADRKYEYQENVVDEQGKNDNVESCDKCGSSYEQVASLNVKIPHAREKKIR